MDDPRLFEIMFSMRALRRLAPDPVPEHLIRRVLEAGTQAPSGQNTQPWAFLVIRDEEDKRFFRPTWAGGGVEDALRADDGQALSGRNPTHVPVHVEASKLQVCKG